MLKRLHDTAAGQDTALALSQVDSLAPFTYGLEYSAPARGGWTIVHIGMLLPESHQVFVCAQSCLRGVVLSAAELGDSSRFSTISVDEDSVLEGNCEEIIIEGVTHILEGLPALPKALLLFTSCIHHFLGTDMKIVFGELNTRFPQVGFVQCWMNPIMRKTKMPPDPFMRKQLYSLLKPADMCRRQVNIIGNNLALRKSSELYTLLEKNGFSIKDICTCHDFREYETMASSRLNLVTNPLGRPAAKELCGRLGQEWVYLPVSYDWEQIREHWKCLSDLLELDFDSICRRARGMCLMCGAFRPQKRSITLKSSSRARRASGSSHSPSTTHGVAEVRPRSRAEAAQIQHCSISYSDRSLKVEI